MCRHPPRTDRRRSWPVVERGGDIPDPAGLMGWSFLLARGFSGEHAVDCGADEIADDSGDQDGGPRPAGVILEEILIFQIGHHGDVDQDEGPQCRGQEGLQPGVADCAGHGCLSGLRDRDVEDEDHPADEGAEQRQPAGVQVVVVVHVGVGQRKCDIDMREDEAKDHADEALFQNLLFLTVLFGESGGIGPVHGGFGGGREGRLVGG